MTLAFADHLPILPIILPILAAMVVLFTSSAAVEAQRGASLAGSVVTLIAAALLLGHVADGTIKVYALGAWPPPFGIALVADRLGATMALLTSLIALPALLAASRGDDLNGKHFHVFFQFQVAGLNGAFLTGDVFNLFVFFEVLLIASYGLMTHGQGRERAREGLRYVVLNLTGSTLFLIALGLTYGSLGTLNFADLGQRIALVGEGDRALVAAAMALLVVVFALKAAVLPLGFWLPATYGAAIPASAALFAVLTKVGVYAILRLDSAVLSAAPPIAEAIRPWIMGVGMATMAGAIFGLFQAERLAHAAGHLAILSSGTLLMAIGLGGEAMLKAVVFYLPHTILATGALFLVAGAVARARGEDRDCYERGPNMAGQHGLALAYLLVAAAIAGMPPFSGFFAKWLMLHATPATTAGYAAVALLIVSGFASVVVLARAGSRLFWEPEAAAPRAAPGLDGHRGSLGIAAALLVALPVFAAQVERLTSAAGAQIAAGQPYARAVIPDPAAIARSQRP